MTGLALDLDAVGAVSPYKSLVRTLVQVKQVVKRRQSAAGFAASGTVAERRARDWLRSGRVQWAVRLGGGAEQRWELASV